MLDLFYKKVKKDMNLKQHMDLESFSKLKQSNI